MIDSADLLTPRDRARRRQLEISYGESGELSRTEDFRNRHRGERCFVIGNGPSLAEQDLSPLADEITFVTNWFAHHPAMELLRPSYYCVASHEVFGGWNNPSPELNRELGDLLRARASGITKFFSYRFANHLYQSGQLPASELRFLLFDRPKLQIDERGTMNLDPSRPLDDGYTVVITFAIFLARLMGFREIILLGCDCDYGMTAETDERKHFYDASLHTSSASRFQSIQRIWRTGGPIFASYEIVKREFLDDGISIVNATSGGKLEVFDRADLRDLV